MQNISFAFCRLLRRRISYDMFQEKEGDLNDFIIALVYISADCDERMNEREIKLFFFVFVKKQENVGIQRVKNSFISKIYFLLCRRQKVQAVHVCLIILLRCFNTILPLLIHSYLSTPYIYDSYITALFLFSFCHA